MREMAPLLKDLCIAKNCPDGYKECATFLCIPEDGDCSFTLVELFLNQGPLEAVMGMKSTEGSIQTLFTDKDV